MLVYGIEYSPKMFNYDMDFDGAQYIVHDKLFSTKDLCIKYLNSFYKDVVLNDRKNDENFDFDNDLEINDFRDEIKINVSSEYVFNDDAEYLTKYSQRANRFYYFIVRAFELN